jgi:hypothetical protein
MMTLKTMPVLEQGDAELVAESLAYLIKCISAKSG